MSMGEFKSRSEMSREEIIDMEHSLECEMYGKDYPDTFKRAYMKDLSPDEIDEIGLDHSAVNLKIGDRYMTSFYTPYGIKGIDSWLSKQIKNGPGRYTKNEMKRMIRRNPHLSNLIKTNLLDNLESMWK